jgi:hypothetical protein
MIKTYHTWEARMLHPDAMHIEHNDIYFQLCTTCSRLELQGDYGFVSSAYLSNGVVVVGDASKCFQLDDAPLEDYSPDISPHLMTNAEWSNYFYDLWVADWKKAKQEEQKEKRKQATLRRRYERYLTKLNALTYDEWLNEQKGVNNE